MNKKILIVMWVLFGLLLSGCIGDKLLGNGEKVNTKALDGLRREIMK